MGSRWFGALALGLCGLVLGVPVVSAASLNVRITPSFNGARLGPGHLALTNAAGQQLSVTRLDFLLADFALRRADGVWLERTNWQAFFSLDAGRLQASVPELPPGRYDRVRFHVGLRPELAADPWTGYGEQAMTLTEKWVEYHVTTDRKSVV